MNSLIIFVLACYCSACCFGQNLCRRNYFKLPGMKNCHPLLTCSDLPQIVLKKSIGYGAVKHVFLATWGKLEIAYSVLKNLEYLNDFKEGLQLTKILNPSHYIIQLVGYCESGNIILTEYHRFNNANNLIYLLENRTDKLRVGMKLCLNYAEILDFLHNSPIGIRVNCDSNGLTKLLSQYLIKSDLSIVLNDLDALPELTNMTVICGQERVSDLTVPEQLVSYSVSTNLNFRRGYSEKSDIWKVPDICNFFLRASCNNVVQYSLFGIHKKCKELNPNKRPSSSYLVEQYKRLINYVL